MDVGGDQLNANAIVAELNKFDSISRLTTTPHNTRHKARSGKVVGTRKTCLQSAHMLKKFYFETQS